MFLTKLEIADFLGITSATIDFGPLTLLYGPNGAGKSSALDAILHAATGDVVRHEVVAGCIREGAKVASIDAHFAGGSIRREITRKGRAVFVDGVELAAKDAAPEIARILPASQNALRAALRSGALLDMKPADLQALLATLCGAAGATPAFAADIVERAARIGLDLPRTLSAFDTATKRAVEIRKEAKAALADREQQLASRPPPHGSLIDAARSTDLTALRQRIADIQRQRDAAAGAGGARAQRRGDVMVELANIPAQPVPDVAALRKAADEAQRAVVRAEEALRSIDREIAQAPRSVEQAPSAADARAAAERATVDAAKAEAAVNALVKDGTALGEIVKRLSAGAGAECPHCTQAIPADLVTSLESRLDALRKQHAEAAGRLVAAVSARQAATLALAAAQRAEDARAAIARVEMMRQQRPAVAADLDAAIAAEQQARAARDAAVRVAEQQATRARLTAELARLDVPAPTGDVATIDADLAKARDLEAAIPVVQFRDLIERQVVELQQRATDADALVEGLQSARVEALARLVKPFVDAATEALAIVMPGVEVEVAETSDGRSGDGIAIAVRQRGERRSIAVLSDGERTRVLYALQLAVVRLAKVPLLLLDRAELVDDAGRDAVKRLAARAASEGIQVVMATSKVAPEISPVAAYVVSAGRVSRIPAARAA